MANADKTHFLRVCLICDETTYLQTKQQLGKGRCPWPTTTGRINQTEPSGPLSRALARPLASDQRPFIILTTAQGVP